MSVLIDSNVLLRSAEPTHAQHHIAMRAVEAMVARSESLVVVPQVLYEFWVASTRPLDRNGLGFSSAAADVELQKIRSFFVLLDDVEGIFSRWHDLVVQHDVKGKVGHDA